MKFPPVKKSQSGPKGLFDLDEDDDLENKNISSVLQEGIIPERKVKFWREIIHLRNASESEKKFWKIPKKILGNT